MKNSLIEAFVPRCVITGMVPLCGCGVGVCDHKHGFLVWVLVESLHGVSHLN